MKICLIGNSHVGAYKMGWDLIRDDFSDIQLDFFGASGQRMKHLEATGRTLWSKNADVVSSLRVTSGGRSEVDIDDYDHFVVVASGLSLHLVVHLYSAFRSDEHQRSGQYLLSPDAFASAVRHRIGATAAIHIWTLLVDLERRNVTLTPNPLPGPGLARMPDDAQWRELALNGDEALIVASFDAYLAELQDSGAHIARQPRDTLFSSLFTKPEYSAVSSKPPNSDILLNDVHKSPADGALALRELIGHVRSL